MRCPQCKEAHAKGPALTLIRVYCYDSGRAARPTIRVSYYDGEEPSLHVFDSVRRFDNVQDAYKYSAQHNVPIVDTEQN